MWRRIVYLVIIAVGTTFAEIAPLVQLRAALEGLPPHAMEELYKHLDSISTRSVRMDADQREKEHWMNRLLLYDQETRRQSFTRACGEVIGTATRAEIAEVATFFIDSTLASTNLTGSLGPALQVLLATVNYDIMAVKVCASCADMKILYEGEAFLQDNANVYGAYQSYCGSSVYGYDATHSALVFLPVDNATKTIRGGELRGMLAMHLEQITVTAIPSERWPTNLRDGFIDTPSFAILEIFSNFLEPMMATTTGAVAVIPDFLGYGSSSLTFARTPYVQASYMQAGVLSYFAAQNYLKGTTGSCSILSKTLSVVGFSEGGYGAVAASLALRRLGFRLLGMFLAAPFLDMQLSTLFSIESYDTFQVEANKRNFLLQAMLPYNFYVVSIDLPGLANTGSNQTFLSTTWTNTSSLDRNVIEWFAHPDPLILDEIIGVPGIPGVAPFPVLEVMNEKLLQFLRTAIENGVTSPCTDTVVPTGLDLLCQVMLDFSVLAPMATIDFPTSVCYSEQDTLVPVTSFPDSLFLNENIDRTTGLIGGLLPVTGDHLSAGVVCMIASVLYYTVTGPRDTEDGPSIVTELSEEDAFACTGSYAPTSSPAASLTVTPTVNPPSSAQTALSVLFVSLAAAVASFFF